jgi:tRNA threonylcarbamoyladenosine biosynthesis protein TsaB
MNILAIDTCTDVASVTLYSSGVKTSRMVSDIAKSSGHILKLCDEVFSEADTKLSEVDFIAYTKGPGAFTGVRMCIGVVQGLSLACNIPTLGFSTLELLGYRASKKFNTQKVASAIDARMGEVYWAVYLEGIVKSERICKPEQVDKLSAEFVGVGSGWKIYKDSLIKASEIKCVEPDFYPDSSDLVDLSILSIDLGKKVTHELPQPTYLRNNVAQKSLK